MAICNEHVRSLCVPFQNIWDNAADDDGENLSGLLSQLLEEECRLLLDAWKGLLDEAEGARAPREEDEFARRIAWE